MAAENNAAIIQSMYDELLKNGDMNALFSRLSSDAAIKLSIPVDTPLGGEFQTKEGVGTFFQRLNEHIEMGGIELREIVPHKNTVIVIGHENGRIRATGKTFDNEFATIFTLKDGQISHILVIEDMSLVTEAFRLTHAHP